MPSAESNRRIIGRGILQLYSADDEYIIEMGELKGQNIENYDIGFEPKVLIIMEKDIEIFTEDKYLTFDELEQDKIRVDIKPKGGNGTQLLEFSSTGFTLSFIQETGIFIAIGGN